MKDWKLQQSIMLKMQVDAGRCKLETEVCIFHFDLLVPCFSFCSTLSFSSVPCPLFNVDKKRVETIRPDMEPIHNQVFLAVSFCFITFQWNTV
jgi:hypothetical protein